uniref:Uncharacterized protein n=1 Tax=Romanomermis culicivorax TaxID=13658 RepID=A0A915LDQ8_ROMCU
MYCWQDRKSHQGRFSQLDLYFHQDLHSHQDGSNCLVPLRIHHHHQRQGDDVTRVPPRKPDDDVTRFPTRVHLAILWALARWTGVHLAILCVLTR